MRPILVLSAAVVLLAAVRVDAQHTPNQPPAQRPPATPGQPNQPGQPAQPAQPANPAAAAASPANDNAEKPKFDPAAVERGKQIIVQQCGFCHGSNARGGQQGPDLTRSALVQSDENGKQLGEFLKVGRPEKAMPPFPHLAQGQDLEDLAAFLHYTIESVANRGKYQILNILVGDPRKGQAFFEGAGRCVSCHSTTGDLKGVGGKYEDAVTLQQRIAMPRGRRRGRPQPGAAAEQPPFLQPTAVKATVDTPGGPVTGPLVRLTDFDVTIYDAGAQRMRTWLRKDGVPAVTVTDPLQGHMDLLRKWTDEDLHNTTAYLATLK